MMDYPLTLNHILERAGKLFGTVEIVSRLPDKSLHRCTYADVYDRSRRLAEALQKAGIRRGDRVATLMWNHYAHLEAYFGIPASGGVLHTLNLRLHQNDIAYIVNHAEDRFLIVDDVLLPLLEKFKDLTSFERVFVVNLTGLPVSGYESYEDFLETAEGHFEYPDLDEREAAAMCYTSGTTGRPKGVVYSHRSLVLHSLACVMKDYLSIGQNDVVLPVVPMFHVNSWGIPYDAAMVGAKQVLPGPHLDAESLLNLLESEQVTTAAGVPTIWMAIANALEKEPERWKLKKIRMIVGGSAAPEGLIRTLDRFGLPIVHAWGMTETAPLGTVSYLKDNMFNWSEDRQYTVRAKQGIAAPFVEMRIVNDKGEAPWDGVTMGELQVRGPWIAGTYYGTEDATQGFTADGWFRTGDIATIDSEGFMKITDRIKDLVKSGGEWISSVDLENKLMGHQAVAEAAVFAIPHPKWNERPAAAVILKAGMQASPEVLRAYLEEEFAKWWLPDVFLFVNEIPRTSSGKFLKSALRELYKEWEWKEASNE
nr:long-chain fatty acid--CoA ligase [Paenibacillus sp. yr247]